MKFNFENAKYDIQITTRFKNDYKKIRKQGKDINKLINVLETLANGENWIQNIKIINLKMIKSIKIVENVTSRQIGY